MHTIEYAHEGFVQCLSLTSDDKLMYSASNDSTIKIWDFEKRECIAKIKDAHESSNVGEGGMMRGDCCLRECVDM